jgi:hypothetical protein
MCAQMQRGTSCTSLIFLGDACRITQSPEVRDRVARVWYCVELGCPEWCCNGFLLHRGQTWFLAAKCLGLDCATVCEVCCKQNHLLCIIVPAHSSIASGLHTTALYSMVMSSISGWVIGSSQVEVAWAVLKFGEKPKFHVLFPSHQSGGCMLPNANFVTGLLQSRWP